MIDVHSLDPFTTIWRASHRRRSSRETGHPSRFHLDPNCPVASGVILKGRLGAVLAHKWELCSYEADPINWNRHKSIDVAEGRRRAEAAINQGRPLAIPRRQGAAPT